MNHYGGWRNLVQLTSGLQRAKPPGGGGGIPAERGLAKMREAHQKALANVATLEEEIE